MTVLERLLERTRRLLPRYPEAVMDRHRKAADEYGDSWRTRSLTGLAAEVREEGLDVAGWAMLVGARLDEVDPIVRERCRELVLSLIDDGARVTAQSERLKGLLAHYSQRNPRKPWT